MIVVVVGNQDERLVSGGTAGSRVVTHRVDYLATVTRHQVLRRISLSQADRADWKIAVAERTL
jgi:hypothetical protein